MTNIAEILKIEILILIGISTKTEIVFDIVIKLAMLLQKKETIP
jgi:multisubunit Na+/H+ antiporter MnhF subunit